MADTFQFFKRSADKPPGFGAGESVSDPSLYTSLAAYPNWRRLFSDCWEEDLVIDGLTYRTHHHAFQAAKFRAGGHPKVAALFTKESGHSIGLGSALEAWRARKRVMLTPEQMEAWDKVRGEAKDRIYATKFRRGTRAAAVLEATGNATLVSRPPRGKRIECLRLMAQRKANRKSL